MSTRVIFILSVLCLAQGFSPLLPAISLTLSRRPVLNAAKLSDLPRGISPFEKGDPSGLPDEFRSRASRALQQARKDGKRLLEIEFPPLLFKGKSSFDDFDNLQELNLNRDWCIEWMATLSVGTIWLIMPDLKECQLAQRVWIGARYRQAAKFTSIEAVTKHYTQGSTSNGNDGSSSYNKPWGATFSDGISNLLSKGGLMGDPNAMDELEGSADLHLVCQPGNGGPVEDWVNCETLHKNSGDSSITLIVNGALDKVRDGYYPGIVFPKLAATVDRFYKSFESIFYLRPLSDKGCYGWLYRVYPEPWQVVLQTVKEKGNNQKVVEGKVVYTSDSRPTFATALQKLVQGAAAAAAAANK